MFDAAGAAGADWAHEVFQGDGSQQHRARRLRRDARAEWPRVVSELDPQGLLARIDESLLLDHCVAVATVRECYRDLALRPTDLVSGRGRSCAQGHRRGDRGWHHRHGRRPQELILGRYERGRLRIAGRTTPLRPAAAAAHSWPATLPAWRWGARCVDYTRVRPDVVVESMPTWRWTGCDGGTRCDSCEYARTCGRRTWKARAHCYAEPGAAGA